MRAKDKHKILKTVDKLVEYNKTLEKFRGSSKYLFDKILRECNKLVDEIDISDCSFEEHEALGEYKKLINSPEYDADLVKKALDVFFSKFKRKTKLIAFCFCHISIPCGILLQVSLKQPKKTKIVKPM